MSTKKSQLLIVLILLGFCLAPAKITNGQSAHAPITGEWRIEFTRKDPEEVQLTMSLGKSQNWGDGIKISELQGLPREAMNSPVAVTLRLVRDAGTFELVGSFRDGKGSGRFTLTPDQSFFFRTGGARLYEPKRQQCIFGGDGQSEDRIDRCAEGERI